MATDTGGERRHVKSYDEMYRGRWLRAGLLGDAHVPVTIEDVWMETLIGDEGPEEETIMSFVGKSAHYVLPKINAVCLVAMFGKQIDDWRRKRIVLYATAEIMPMPRKRGDSRPPEPCIRIWGSPDIAQDVPVTFSPPRRRPIQMVMRATGTVEAPAPEEDAPFHDDD